MVKDPNESQSKYHKYFCQVASTVKLSQVGFVKYFPIKNILVLHHPILMESKSAVSALQEFCAKSRKCLPTYDFIIGKEGGYVCKVTAMEIECYGNGLSKRDAKNLAAEDIWRKIRELPGVSNEIHNLNRDVLKELRAYCIRHEMPLPMIEVVKQSGTWNAPEFVICCSVGSLLRYAKSDTKKDARQRAAIEVLAVVTGQNKKSADGDVKMNRTVEDLKMERRLNFNTYRELTDGASVDNKEVRLCDRHNYFKNFSSALKEAAFEVIRSDKYGSTKDQALSLLSALKLTPSIEAIASTAKEPLLKIELNCEFDCLFLGLEDDIYGQIIDYFKVMLV